MYRTESCGLGMRLWTGTEDTAGACRESWSPHACVLPAQVGKQPPRDGGSRKQRRKTRNLREEYARRQRNHVWLETHIWHAKRMHMTDYHGYRVAKRAADKGVRQAYRSMQYGCLMSVSRAPSTCIHVYVYVHLNSLHAECTFTCACI